MKHLIAGLLLIGVLCHAEDKVEDSWKHPDPMTYESLRAWHARGGLGQYHWPKEHQLDLNGDGKHEVFLGVMGFGRGMVYGLYTKKDGKWEVLSESVEGSHHGFAIMPGKPNGWSDFRSLQPSGRGGLFETIYSWNGREYVEKESREISHEELDHEDIRIKGLKKQ